MDCVLHMECKFGRNATRGGVWLEGQWAVDSNCGLVCLVARLDGWRRASQSTTVKTIYSEDRGIYDVEVCKAELLLILSF